MDEKLIGSLAAIAGNIEAIKRSLVAKGVVSEEELQSHFPKAEESDAMYTQYFEPFFGPLKGGKARN